MALLNMSCGQTSLHPRVLEAMGTQVKGPIYYPAYWNLEIETIALLRQLMHTQNDVLLIAGSATYGLEAALCTLVEPEEKILVVNSGKYGQVMADLAEIVGGTAINLEALEGKAVGIQSIRQVLLENPDIALIAAVHCDTSTGIMTPIDEIGQMLAYEFPDKLFLVDAVASLAGTALHVDDWHIDVAFTSPQKCLNGPQGLAIVSVSQRAWESIAQRNSPTTSLCLDLTVWREYHAGLARAHATERWIDVSTSTRKAVHGPSPSYTLVAGLHAALEAFFAEGPERVFARHDLASQAVRVGVRATGLKVYADEAVASPVSTRIVFDQPVDWTEIMSRMLNAHGIFLASGFRIGTMGESANPDSVLITLEKLQHTLSELGYPVKSGIEEARLALLTHKSP